MQYTSLFFLACCKVFVGEGGGGAGTGKRFLADGGNSCKYRRLPVPLKF